MVSVCLTELWGKEFCHNDNPGCNMVNDAGTGSDMQEYSEDMRYSWYVCSCCINSSVSSAQTLHVRSISSDQTVYSMS